MEMKEAMAGTLESGDIFVQISPAATSGTDVAAR
ncbi:MAG: citrate lyase ACP, partial [Prevotella sp.]|nr:citrate lyase ACP [Prevotella sp.]